VAAAVRNDPGVEHPVADRHVLGPGGHQPPADLAQLTVATAGEGTLGVPLLLVPDDVDLLGRRDVVVGRQRGLPLGGDRLELDHQVLGTAAGGVATTHVCSSPDRPDRRPHERA
jgi:hypothetical protein